MVPLISIIVPVYNAEGTLNRCINSIIKQTFSNWELLLIDDGSTDQSYEICDEYAAKDQRIKAFHKKNGGVSSARNIGLDYATGEWITFCDSDDYVNSNWLDIYMSLINRYNVDMVCQGMQKTGLDVFPKYCPGIDYYGDSKNALIHLKESLLLGFVWNKILKKSIIDKNELFFDENIVFMEDEEFILKYFKYCKMIACTANIGYNYVISFSSTKQKYSDIDNYYVALSNFRSIKYIFKSYYNHIYQSYLDMLTNSFFASYQLKTDDIKKRLNLYKKEVGRDVFKVNGLSIVSKLIFLLPVDWGNTLFLIKSKIK